MSAPHDPPERPRLKLKAVGVGVLAYLAYGTVLAFMEGTMLTRDGATVGAAVIFVAAVLTARHWHNRRAEKPVGVWKAFGVGLLGILVVLVLLVVLPTLLMERASVPSVSRATQTATPQASEADDVPHNVALQACRLYDEAFEQRTADESGQKMRLAGVYSYTAADRDGRWIPLRDAIHDFMRYQTIKAGSTVERLRQMEMARGAHERAERQCERARRL